MSDLDIEQKILKESYHLFHQYGIKSVTMDDIAKKLVMSKKTLYKHFSNKKELVLSIMKVQITETQNQCLSMVSDSDDAIHELFLVMKMIKDIFHNINPSLLYDLQKYHPKAWELMEEHQNGFMRALIADTLKRGITEKLFRDTLSIRIITKLRLEEMKTSFNPEIFSPKEYNMEEVQLVMMEHFILGITTLKGHEIALEYQKKLKNA